MPMSKADMIRLLEMELDFIEGGGYEPSVRDKKVTRVFQDTVACINNWFVPAHDPGSHEGCVLLDFVPDEHKGEDLPCYYIPLNEAGDTVASLEEEGDPERLEQVVKQWLRATIARLKEDLAESEQQGSETADVTY